MRDTIRSVGVAALAVLAVSLAAATLDSTATTGRRDPSAPVGSGGATGGLLPLPNAGTAPGRAIPSQLPHELFVLLGTLAVLVVVVHLLRYRRVTLWGLVGLTGLLSVVLVVSPAYDPLAAILVVLAALATVAYAALYRRALLRSVLGSVVALFLLVIVAQFLSSARPRSPGSLTYSVPGTVFGGSGGGPAAASRAAPPTLLLVSILGLAIVGAIVAFRRSPGDDERAPESDDATDGQTVAVGRAAGRAADRLARTGRVDNEVYRAWREMTGLLAVSAPATSTPGEFAAAATEAGLGREDVAELTRLFEDVRYGETPPTDEIEERAVAVFRRIEARYAEADA